MPDKPGTQIPNVVPTSPPVRPSRRGEFDAEIERELEAAMAGLDAKSLLGETERRVKRGPEQPADPWKKGKVVAMRGDDVFVDIGGRCQGLLSLAQFPEGPPAIGSPVDVIIEGYDRDDGLLILSRKGSAVSRVDWSSVAEGMIVEGRVTGTNKGGLEIEVNGIRGFMPISHIELFRVEDTQPYVNQRLKCLVTDVNPAEKNLILSRRALLEKEREEARERLWQELAEGQIRTGTVRSVKDFGAFLDLGGVDGLLPVSEMSWSRVDDTTKFVQPGQQLQVIVLRLDPERRKVSLGLKQLLPGPWDDIGDKFPEGSVVSGKVTRLADFGAFVELTPGLEGLIHISELATHRVQRPGNVVQVGQDVQVKVLKVDVPARRISLSIKQAATGVEPQPEPGEEPVKRKEPSRKTPLKGGLG